MAIKICSDVDLNDCCDDTFEDSEDWEDWEDDEFGGNAKCNNKQFQVLYNVLLPNSKIYALQVSRKQCPFSLINYLMSLIMTIISFIDSRSAGDYNDEIWNR